MNSVQMAVASGIVATAATIEQLTGTAAHTKDDHAQEAQVAQACDEVEGVRRVAIPPAPVQPVPPRPLIVRPYEEHLHHSGASGSAFIHRVVPHAPAPPPRVQVVLPPDDGYWHAAQDY